MQIRIKGLVRFFNDVRRQLQGGIPQSEVNQFKKDVAGIIQQVELICRNHGGTPSELPAPSRNAYMFLKNLDLDKLSIRDSNTPSTGTRRINIKNLVSIGDYFAKYMWGNLEQLISEQQVRRKLLGRINLEVDYSERICADHNSHPSSLPVRSRQTYCWLKFLASEDNFAAHLEALKFVRHLSTRVWKFSRSLSIEFHMINMGALYRSRTYRDHALIKCSEGFTSAGGAVWRALFENIFNGRTKECSDILNHYAASEEYNSVLFEMESFSNPPSESLKGHVHDLEASFQRINEQYFKGAFPKPRLTWNQVLTVAKFGHYQVSRDTVMLSISLDQPQVPAYVLDFVMYHELLHKKHGATLLNGRRFVHTPEFRAEERKFEQFTEATGFLHKLARKQRGIPEQIVAESEEMFPESPRPQSGALFNRDPSQPPGPEERQQPRTAKSERPGAKKNSGRKKAPGKRHVRKKRKKNKKRR